MPVTDTLLDKIALPATIRDALKNGAFMVISISGGKDSDAMVHLLPELAKREGWFYRMGDPISLIHADLGRAEWTQTPGYIVDVAKRSHLPTYIVKHSKYDLLDEIKHRMDMRPDAPPWPSSAMRYCTADQKRGPISKWIRHSFPYAREIVCAIGIRSQESPARAKKPIYEVREDCWSEQKQRFVFNWNPLFNFTEDDVWETLDGYPHHPAYDLGNKRLSCAMCVLATVNDITNGARNDPDLYIEYCRIEMQSGYSFKKGFWLCSLFPELLPPDILGWWQWKLDQLRAL